MATPPTPLPPLTSRWVDITDGSPSQILRQYMLSLDAVVRALTGGNIGPVASAVDDAAAASAGVAVGGIYQSGGMVRIRIK
jgi:hypothetical protein